MEAYIHFVIHDKLCDRIIYKANRLHIKDSLTERTDGDNWRELFTNLLTYLRTTLHPPLRLRFLWWMNALCQYLVVQMKKISVHCKDVKIYCGEFIENLTLPFRKDLFLEPATLPKKFLTSVSKAMVCLVWILNVYVYSLDVLLLRVVQYEWMNTLQCWIVQVVRKVHTALVCEKSTLQIILMAQRVISHYPNNTHGSGF